MNERKRPLSGLLSDLAGVVSDLSQRNAEAGKRLTEALQAAPALPEIPLPPGGLFPRAVPQAAPSTPVPQAAPANTPPSPDALWKTADEPVDWTEALSSPTPTDGLTSPEKWALYHAEAAAVLHGDVAAYRRVLAAADPFGDLAPLTDSLAVEPVSADEVRADLVLRPDPTAEDPRRILCGMALRIARDVFAALPVTCVSVEACGGDALHLRVCFQRKDLARIRFAFADPVELVLGCGGQLPAES